MDSSMANMGQGQVQQTSSGTTMDNVAKSNERRSDAVLQKATGIQRDHEAPTKVRIDLSFDELKSIEYAIRIFYEFEEDEEGHYGDLIRKIKKYEDKALEKEMKSLKWIKL